MLLEFSINLMNPYSILFLSSSEISLPLLKALSKDSRFNVTSVICQPDKPSGRDMLVTSPITKVVAEKLGLKVFQPVKLNEDFVLFNSFKNSPPDFLLTFSYGQIINSTWLDLPNKFPLNVHASLLPKYRGASPIVSSILNGDAKTGISLMKMEANLDSGPIAFKHEIDIKDHMTTGMLSGEIAELAAHFIPEDLVKIAESVDVSFEPQDEKLATFTYKIKKEDGLIDFKMPAFLILRRFKAFSDWPTIYTFFKGKRLKFVDIEVSDLVLAPGEVFVDGKNIFVGTSDGSLHIKQLQIEGKQVLYSEQFLLGYNDFRKAVLPS